MFDVGTNIYSRDLDGNGPSPQTGGVVDHRPPEKDHGVFADIMRRVIPAEKHRLKPMLIEEHGSSNKKTTDQWRHGNIMHNAEAWVHEGVRHLIVMKRKVSDDGTTGKPWRERYRSEGAEGSTIVKCW